MKKRNTKTRSNFEEQLCQVFHRWMEERDGVPGDLGDCYEFAKKRGLYEAPRMTERRLFKMEMSKALSRERLIDDEGTPIRRNHVFRVKNEDDQGYLFFWGELMKMKPAQVTMSMKQRLLGLANRAIQLDRDKTYYNTKNTYGAQIELDYNLNPHVDDSKNPTEYPDERPEDGDDAQPV